MIVRELLVQILQAMVDQNSEGIATVAVGKQVSYYMRFVRLEFAAAGWSGIELVVGRKSPYILVDLFDNLVFDLGMYRVVLVALLSNEVDNEVEYLPVSSAGCVDYIADNFYYD